MKQSLLIKLFMLFAFATAFAQPNPVKWKTSIKAQSVDELLLTFEATIEKDWHMYSQYNNEMASLPTVFEYEDSGKGYSLEGKTKESNYKVVYSEIFLVDEFVFYDKATFTQLVKVTNPKLEKIIATIDYQVCKEQCIQQFEKIEFVIPKSFTEKIAKNIAVVNDLPEDIEKPDTETDTAIVGSLGTLTTTSNDITDTKESVSAETSKIEESASDRSVWNIFIVAFFSGFAALLTPCVFPMIPMTVSVFTKQSKNRSQGIRNAVFYGLSIIVIYVLLGTIVSKIFGSDSLNELSTSVTFNLVFFTLLVFFAMSFLGAFEIMLPNRWLNTIDKQSMKGGIIGIFFMALALAIVSFSCTGPIVGSLLVEAASKGGMAPVVGMLGFSMAIAIPFMLFAMFPGWMNSLPKSGGWLNSVKVSLGFLELAFAFKFLSKADLVLQLHWLERELFLAIWIAIFGAWALYLFGKISLPHDSPIVKISVGRLLLALLVSTFTLYLIPGLWGAPLKLISGFPPPLYYSESPNGFGSSGGVSSSPSSDKIEGTKTISHGLQAFIDYEAGLAYAQKMNKPVLLDFTGYGCENCRKMEDYVWSDPEILNILKNDLIIISLYIDDKKPLPENEQYVSEKTGKKIRTVGNKWSDFQIKKYNSSSQPYYLIINPKGETLSSTSASYDPSIPKFKTWLEEGIAKMK